MENEEEDVGRECSCKRSIKGEIKSYLIARRGRSRSTHRLEPFLPSIPSSVVSGGIIGLIMACGCQLEYLLIKQIMTHLHFHNAVYAHIRNYYCDWSGEQRRVLGTPRKGVARFNYVFISTSSRTVQGGWHGPGSE